MSAQARRVASVLAAALVTAASGTVHAQTSIKPLTRLRVVAAEAPVVPWYPYVRWEVAATVRSGATLEALDRQDDWYWVMLPRDGDGGHRSGWIQARHVEVLEPPAPSVAAAATRPARPETTAPPPEPAPVPAPPPAAPEAPQPAPAAAPARQPVFQDVHFALNSSVIRPEDRTLLDEAAATLKGDPSLRLDVEGYTCSLGPRPYNLRLGDRRARAVKQYLVDKGVEADRLHTVSYGEDRPKYDNSHEATRKLNRRVALVPQPRD